MAVPDRLSALELSPLLSTAELGRTLHYFESLTSTNEVAHKLAAEGAQHGEVVICEEQTAGKGRRGRHWQSPRGVNLYFSVVLRPDLPPQRAPELTLVAAVSLAQTLREAGANASIKWPNDLVIDDLKVAGILTELSADQERVNYAVLGMGVNVNCRREDLPPEVASIATSLMLARGERVPRALFAAALWARLEGWLERHATEGFGVVREAWKELSSTLGQKVLVKEERRELVGIAEDIDESGALLVRREDGGLERVVAGDVEQLRARKAE